MNDEKELLENEAEEVTPEVAEEIIEEPSEEIAEEAVEEIAEEVIENAEAIAEDVEAVVEKAEISKSAVAVISAAITFAVCVIIVGVLYFTTYNKYNANVDGFLYTIAEEAENAGKPLKDFKEEFGLPKDMQGNTTSVAAQSYIATGKFIEMSYGMTFEQFSQIVGITEEDEVDENSPWGKTQKVMIEKTKAKQEAAEQEATEDEAAEGEAVEGEAAEQEPVHPDDAAE